VRQHAGSSVPPAQSCWCEVSTVGIFAGRGDVLVAMGLALIIGVWIGWKAKSIVNWISTRKLKKEDNHV